jgi:hypothetical protein
MWANLVLLAFQQDRASVATQFRMCRAYSDISDNEVYVKIYEYFRNFLIAEIPLSTHGRPLTPRKQGAAFEHNELR